MSSDIYKTLAGPAEGFFKDRGSRFSSFAFPVNSDIEIKEILNRNRKQFHDATHQCYAYRIGTENETWRVNDDGEPSGSAGRPIYGQVLSKELTNILVVVIRYYGGVKLGVSGLIHAYKSAAANALDNGTIIEKTVNVSLLVNFEYNEMNQVMKLIKDENVVQQEHHFDIHCSVKLTVRKSESERIAGLFGRIDRVKVEIYS